MNGFATLLRAFADHHEHGDDLRAALSRIENKVDAARAENAAALQALQERIDRMSSTLDTDLNALDSQIAELTTEVDSSTAFMDGIQGFIQAAVAKDQAAGATPAQLANVTQAIASIGAMKDRRAASILKNTPSDPAAPPAADQAPPPGGTPTVAGGADTVTGSGGTPTVAGGADTVTGAAAGIVALDPTTGQPIPQPALQQDQPAAG